MDRSAPPPAVEMADICKSFGGVPVLRHVNLTVRRGEIHALMGENGAGKSTLMRILGGIHTDHQGDIAIDGEPVVLASPREAARHGISIIHQELNLVPHLSVAANIFLGREPVRGLCFVDTARMVEEAGGFLRPLNFRAEPIAPVASLRVGEQQLVEIAKALALRSRILVMDEPTSALSTAEVELLFATMRRLTAQGVSIIYITHRMDEVFAIADTITVLRDGMVVLSAPARGTSRRAVINAMVGREVSEFFVERRHALGPVVLAVDELWLDDPERAVGRRRVIDGVSFEVRAGEVLGIAGLLGAGRTEILETLFGASQGRFGGTVRLNGRLLDIQSPVQAKAAGFAMITEDRKRFGLVLNAPLAFNIALPSMPAVSAGGVVSRPREVALALAAIRQLGIRATGPAQDVGTLSGGNQQKAVIGKWLATEPEVLLLDEPTRGIDVGAKAEIYRLIANLADRGLALVIVSSELPEIMSLSDRILVMREGRPTALLERSEFSAEALMDFASPGGDVQPRFRRGAAAGVAAPAAGRA